MGGWVGGCLWTTQANNAKLNFARGFLRRFSLSLSCWKEVIHLAHLSFPILSAMNIDIISGTIAAILWPWSKDLQNYRDVDSNYLASEPVSFLYHSNTKLYHFPARPIYLFSPSLKLFFPVSSHGWLHFMQIDLSLAPQGGCLWPPHLK